MYIQQRESDSFFRRLLFFYPSTPNAIEWSTVSDATMRIEAVLSGQAIVTGEPIAIQPSSPTAPACLYSNLTPIPHTIVVIKTHRRVAENRACRVGRISRQYLPDDSDACDCIPSCWRRRKPVLEGPLITC
jgi:hypothetical protein